MSYLVQVDLSGVGWFDTPFRFVSLERAENYRDDLLGRMMRPVRIVEDERHPNVLDATASDPRDN